MKTPRLVVAALLAGSVWLPGPRAEGEDRLPPEFQQIIPRGRIASVDQPRFVAASEAKLPPEAWVFGVLVDG